jgi:glycerol kinase
MAMKDGSFLLAIDQGTSATKAVLFDLEGTLVGRSDTPLTQQYPQPGWVEHDPEEIFSGLVRSVHNLMQETGTDLSSVRALSISNQRETVILWDRETGMPVMHAIVWQCQRAEDLVSRLAQRNVANMVQRKTGLRLSPYFSAAKAAWIIEHSEDARQLLQQKRLLFGTVDSYLVWKLTGGKVHATDFTNASRTQLLNLHTLDWDDELLSLFGLHRSMMPELRSSNASFGTTEISIFGCEMPIAGVIGDSHAAFFAQRCISKGSAKATYGTGSSIMMHIGSHPIREVHKVVCSIGYAIDGQITYVLEGNINCTGATIKWLVDDLELISSSKEAGALAASVDDTLGVYLVPAFVGLGSPYWDSRARAAITHMSRGVKKAHIVRAAEESIAYQITDVIRAMESESGITLQELRVDGGPTRDAFLMQFQADILDVPVIRTEIEELSAAGAMYMGALALHLYKDVQELQALRGSGKRYTPSHEDDWRKTLYDGWKRAVATVTQAD